MMTHDAAIDAAIRTSYGKLVAIIAARTGDVEGAEDAISDAVVAGLEQWPTQGIPKNPTAWLLTVARRRIIDEGRRSMLLRTYHADVVSCISDWNTQAVADPDLPDERLSLMFACAHPAIAASVRTPLMLQCVLGLSAERIASAFLTSPSSMSQRLVRAKAKIRATGLAMDVPHPRHLPTRVPFVADAIYAAFTTASGDLEAESIELARIMTSLMPEDRGSQGLLALLLFSYARRHARRDRTGAFVPLHEQDPDQWDLPTLLEATTIIEQLMAMGHTDRFTIEAAIQHAHSSRRHGGSTPWPLIVELYDALVARTSAIGAVVARAVAIAEARGPGPGLDALNAISTEQSRLYQPYWVARAHLLQQLGKGLEADACRERAIGLTQDPIMRSYLISQRT
ncbi:MAG: RNA polymerase subunit sigma-70 [Bacteroidetes bacterium]|nr:RNA polymerase subunit sigma-70 [Bacteroidota bacterium]